MCRVPSSVKQPRAQVLGGAGTGAVQLLNSTVPLPPHLRYGAEAHPCLLYLTVWDIKAGLAFRMIAPCRPGAALHRWRQRAFA